MISFDHQTRERKTQRDETMTYKQACEVLGYTTPRSVENNAKLAMNRLRSMTPQMPVKYAVACDVLISAANVK